VRRLDFTATTREKLLASGADVVVTGAGGWIGRATLEMLESSLGPAFTERTHAFGSTRRSLTLRSGTDVEVKPLHTLSGERVQGHLLAHYAFVTRDRLSQLGTAEFISTNEQISTNIVEHITLTRPRGLLMTSSGAVYQGDDLSENPYGVLKARDERRFFELCHDLDAETPLRVVIPRLFNLAGPFLNKPDLYALGSIIEDVCRGGPVILRSPHPVIRSYVYVADLVDLGFAMMLGDEALPTTPFDTAGEREIEIGELAELVASVLGRPGTAIQRPPSDGSPADRYVGNQRAMTELLRSFAIKRHDLLTQIQATADFLCG
jgi:UDP-glucuronate decarboxylase